jgi:bacterioferritin (cytochrome b1)
MSERFEGIYSTRLRGKAEKTTCCDEGILKLRRDLVDELADELTASEMYERAGSQMKDEAGMRELGEVLHKMALQEYEHWVRLTAMINVLNELCECGGATGEGGF